MITKAGNRESNRNLFPRVLSLRHLRKEELEEGRDFRMEVAGTGARGIHPHHRMKGTFQILINKNEGRKATIRSPSLLFRIAFDLNKFFSDTTGTNRNYLECVMCGFVMLVVMLALLYT